MASANATKVESLKFKGQGKINILYLITEFDVGGAENMLYEVAMRMDRQKYNIHAACLTGRGPVGKKLSALGIEVEYFCMRNSLDFRIFKRLTRLLRKKNIYILHSYLFHANFIGRVAGKLAGVPVIVSSIRTSEKEKRCHLWLDKLTSGLVDMETCVCEAVRQFTIKEAGISAGKLISIPNGIDLTKFDGKFNSEGKRAELGIKELTKVIGTVGHLSKPKGIEFFLRAAALILKEFQNIVFVIVGSGKLEDELKRLAKGLCIEDNVIFTGFRKDAVEIMSIFDIFVLPSLWEGMPVAVLEAMALSKPVVVTAAGGCPELVTSGENGYLVEPADCTGLSKAIVNILKDPVLAERMGDNSRKKVEQFSVDKMVERTEELYERLVKQKINSHSGNPGKQFKTLDSRLRGNDRERKL